MIPLIQKASAAENKILLFENGRSDYRIVISRRGSYQEKKAAQEFRKYFQEITGTILPIVTDRKRNKPHEIVIGKNLHYPDILKNNRQVDWKEDGFTIQSVNEKLIIEGGKGNGLIYGTHTFFEKYLGCRWYTSRIRIIPHRDRIELDPFDDTEVPVLDFRETYYRDMDHPEFREWLKSNSHTKDWGMWVHTLQRLVPAKSYFSTHPEYFALNEGKRVPYTQLCLSDSNLVGVVIENLSGMMKENPGAKYWSVSQNDNPGFCQCPECAAIDSVEGAHSGSVLHFVNQVARHFPDKIISTLAYQYSRKAPLHVRPGPNVNIMLCSIECNRSQPISTDTSSAAFRKDFDDWGAISNNILVWDYEIQFENLVSPFPNLHTLQPNVQYFVSRNAKGAFMQGNRERGGEFSGLRTYLISKLLWDPWINVDSVMNDYLTGTFGNAGSYIRDYIDLTQKNLEKSGEKLWIYGGPANHMKGFLSPNAIKTYNALFDKAEFVVHNDPALLNRVQVARLPLDFAMLEIARVTGKGPNGIFKQKQDSSWILRREFEEKLNNFVDLCTFNGVTRLKEWFLTPEEYRQSMRELFDKGIEINLAYGKPVQLTGMYSPKYTGDHENALTDGLRGTFAWRHLWQGYEGIDLDGVIDLGKKEQVHSLQIEFLQDVRSWIFMPEKISWSGSEDGENYFDLGVTDNPVSPRDEKVTIHTFRLEELSSRVRYIRIRAKNRRICPSWHPGSGGKAWLFSDEIIIH